ncbi:MAG: cystathionine beta-lyase [Bermanella sp.]|jgi:cystathionine beta-lyase
MNVDQLFGPGIDRSESDSIKWKRYKSKDILPMWVADMDFQVAPEILNAIKQRVEHGVLGYGSDSPELRKLIVKHCEHHYNWVIEPEWIVFTPGVVKGLNLARAISVNKGRPGDITALPVYPHLVRHAPVLEMDNHQFYAKANGNSWSLDLAGMEKLLNPDIGVMLLCNPHNPIGKVYSREELQALAKLCVKHDLIICSDDIHCDLILNGKQHTPIASLGDDVAQRSITLMAPSKTFNVPGLDMAFAIIPNIKMRTQYAKLMDGLVGHVNILGMHAATAAFEFGESWRLKLIEYLKENHQLILDRVKTMSGVSMRPAEATYLAWLDVSSLQLDNPQRYFETFGVGLSTGSEFGDNNYVRLNFGCQRPLLNEALDRIERAVVERMASLEE